jgi:hypothetical protein
MSMTHKLHTLTEQENRLPGGTAGGAAWVVQGMDIQVAQSVLPPSFVVRTPLLHLCVMVRSLTLWTRRTNPQSVTPSQYC